MPLGFAAAALAAAAVHAAVFAGLHRRFGAKGAFLFAAGTLVALAAAGGFRRAAALAVLAAGGVLFAAVGDRAGRKILPDESLSFGVRIGIGIAIFSWAASVALFFGIFTPIFLAALFAAAAAFGAGSFPRLALDLRASAQETADRWNGATAAALEIALLLSCGAVVRNLAPESGFDALTRYLPWLKIAWRTGALPSIPRQFPFILPQAGLAGMAVVSFDPVAQRAAMLGALAVCAAIAAARCRTRAGVGFLVVLGVASCPLVISAAHGLQPDAFGWVAVLLLGVVAVDGKEPASARFWLACGAIAALAWCAKYSTAGFSAALLLYAFWRGREGGVGRNAWRAVLFGGVGAAVASAPWLVHAWRDSRNPFFPLFPSVFPSPLWRMRIDEAWRGGFAFFRGWRGALLWPIDMTIHTNRFGEGHPGSFGLALLVLLFLCAASLRSAGRAERVWLAAAVVGTLLLWTKTPLIRYWIPALWLALPAAAAGAARLSERANRRPVAIGLAAIAAFQTAYATFPSKSDLEGRPWAVYAGRMSEEQYVDLAPGAAALGKLASIDRSRPRVWYTGLYAVGHADVVPLMAERWEIAFHVPPKNRGAVFAYLESAGCRYWAVANELKDRAEFEALGIAARYWIPSQIVVRDASATIYRMPGP